MADPTGVEYYTIPSFQFNGGAQKDINVAYRSFNPTSTAGTVLIPTCYGGRINTTQNFTSGALKDFHVIVAAMLGNGESSSPSNDPDFPSDYSLRYQDCINAHYALLTDHLGVKGLEAVVGFSMGGQQAYYWSVMHGSGSSPFVKRAVVICGSAKTSGHNYAFLEGPTSALIASKDYDGGKYRRTGVKPTEGLRAFGRAYAAWLTSPEWFRRELWREVGAKSLHDWLHPAVEKSNFEAWDAEDLLVLARMWQAGDVGSVGGAGDYKEALRGVSAKVLVMPGSTDQYFPVEDGEEEVKYLRNGLLDPLVSCWGHIAGGGADKEGLRWMDRRIGEFMRED
ncbi:homoserine acetyltransferase like protein [Zymoseptoria brevis]|uniref:Homoserine acetyltransferase like protein n=1 Tax=Zymoseptoria brevis TaxID=1047168 RepID=A0A0F4GJ14_9PEZI|nr:homoserine acetyltransferase like protein [Zymoseptoria brevis]